jgi:hypothetical protein
MHDARSDRLTHPAFDAQSRQPAYTSCVVRVEAMLDSSTHAT